MHPATKNRKRPVLIGYGTIRLEYEDGTYSVFGPKARLLGLPDGSLRVEGAERREGKPAKRRKGQPRVVSISYDKKPR